MMMTSLSYAFWTQFLFRSICIGCPKKVRVVQSTWKLNYEAFMTYPSQKLAIDNKETFSTDWYVQIIDLWEQLLLRKVQFFIVASPKC